MNKLCIIYVLSIAIIAKGQPQKHHVQQQFNQLTLQPNRVGSTKLEIVQEAGATTVKPTSGPGPVPTLAPTSTSFEPLKFPSNEDEFPITLQQQQLQYTPPKPPQPPQLPQLPKPQPQTQHQSHVLEVHRNQGQTVAAIPMRAATSAAIPMRVATATAAPTTNREKVDQFDYIRDFSWTLFQKSKIPSAIGNLVISPIQPQLLLSLLRTAAAGLTEQEIAEAIGELDSRVITELVSQLKHDTSSHTELGIANAIFADDNFQLNNSFIREAHTREVEIFPVNFNSIEESDYIINNWIANATKNQIPSIYRPDASRGVKLLMANTIYFRGEWKYGFNETVSERFETTEKLTKNVPMMKNRAILRSGELNLRSGVTGRWVELPYLSSDFSMIIVLPEQRHQLDALIYAMQPHDFQEIFGELNHSYKKLVNLALPKFTVQSTFSLVNVLLKMGIVDLFTTESRLPYFARSPTEQSLRVDDILQQSILSVDQKGTVAASATVSHVVTLSLSSIPEEIFFKVDEPFLAIIADKRNQVPLFIAKIFDP